MSGILNSYSQVFFSNLKIFSILLILVSFIDIFAGLCGLFSVVVTLVVARQLGLDKYRLSNGIYGFNSLLVGLGLGVYFSPGWLLFFIVFLAAILTLFISRAFEGILGKYTLPFLSLSFIFSFWIFSLASKEFTSLGISERGIYSLNDLYFLGGSRLVNIYDRINQLSIPGSLRTYFISLGAIFFQFNVLSGILIAVGLLYYSRIAFSLSLIGFYTAFFFYQLIGANITELNYSYIGFNFILTALAIGGFFIIPSIKSYLWTIILTPLVVILVVSLNKIFYPLGLPIYSLPFNIMVILFLYLLKFRVRSSRSLNEVFVQQNSPEKNLYSFQNYLSRFSYKSPVSLKLPFFGEWVITQGYKGEYTHRGAWEHALDFMISDEGGKLFSGSGDLPEDYFCYGKAVCAPADGLVEEVINNVPDNTIGEVDVKHNWGNTIIIRHESYLYTHLSHLIPGSITVNAGDRITRGQVIGRCGNSGRSPYPHLHFQVQSAPYIGAPTIPYPLGHYLVKTGQKTIFKSYSQPLKDELVSNVSPTILLQNAFRFIPGKTVKWSLLKEKTEEKWIIKTTPENQLYIECSTTGSIAYFEDDEDVILFTHFKGNKTSVLYYFYLSVYKLQKEFSTGLILEDQYPLNHVFGKGALFIQDFISPFFRFLDARFNLTYYSIDNELSPEKILIRSQTKTYFFERLLKTIDFELEINTEGLANLLINVAGNKMIATCKN